jgi:hypothetical protein
MGVEMGNVRWQFSRQHTSLAKAADAVAGRVAAKIAPPDGVGATESRQPSGGGITAKHAKGLLVKIFGQVVDRCGYFPVHRVDVLVGGMAQRDNPQHQPAPL